MGREILNVQVVMAQAGGTVERLGHTQHLIAMLSGTTNLYARTPNTPGVSRGRAEALYGSISRGRRWRGP